MQEATTSNLAVNQTAKKLRFWAPSGLRRRVTSNGLSMKKLAPPLITFLLWVSGYAFASEDTCPFPVGIQAAMGAAKEAVAAKNSGISKADLLKKLPQDGNSKWLSGLLTEIVQEVYDYPVLRAEVYAAYRFELCFVSQSHPDNVSSIKFADAHPLLEKCELLPQEGARPPCAMKVVHTISGIPE